MYAQRPQRPKCQFKIRQNKKPPWNTTRLILLNSRFWTTLRCTRLVATRTSKLDPVLRRAALIPTEFSPGPSEKVEPRRFQLNEDAKLLWGRLCSHFLEICDFLVRFVTQLPATKTDYFNLGCTLACALLLVPKPRQAMLRLTVALR